jgi:hypothetical protein
MRGRGRGRGVASLPGLTSDTTEGMQEVAEDSKLPPPDYPELWNEKYPFKTIEPCVGNEPYKARMAIKIQMSSKKSPFHLEPDEPVPEIDTWMNRNMMHSKPIKKKPSQTIMFQENLFPFELLPKKMQNTIKKSKRKEKSVDDELKDLLRKEKESGGSFVEEVDDEIEKNDGDKGSQSMDEGANEDMQEDEANKEGIDDDDPELIEGSWMRNDDDSLGQEDDSDGEAMF